MPHRAPCFMPRRCDMGIMDLPDAILAAVAATVPAKSASKYQNAFEHFDVWRKRKNVTPTLSEEALLAYFIEHSVTWKPNTLWARWSMLKTMLLQKYKVDIAEYKSLKKYLSSKSKGYRPKKAKTLEADHIRRFVTEAPDEKYLFTKVALTFSVFGTCRCDELVSLRFDEVHDYGNIFYVEVNETKNHINRKFVIDEDFYGIVKKYISHRPKNAPANRFFVQYHRERCTVQPVGINAFYKQPKIVAEYLGIEDAALFTGHSFRKTSGADMLTIKRAGGWKSDQVAHASPMESSSKIGPKPFDPQFVHEQSNDNDQSFKCYVCNKIFTQKSVLTKHMRIHTREKSYKCDVCNKTFSQSCHLVAHQRCHTGEKPYKCDVCHKSFQQKGHLGTHKRSHGGDKPYKCDNCDKAFIQKSHLVYHKRCHTEGKPYKCDVCDKTFSQRCHLVSHIRGNTRAKPYQCYVCDKLFNLNCLLKNHIRSHIGEV